MAANATRMLVLGVVQIFGPANGYQLRRELLSWGVEAWAHVNPGSIYSMLSTLTKHGLISRHEITSGPRPATVYQPTGSGTAELIRLVGIALETLAPSDPTDFRAAMSFASFLTRDQFLAHGSTRLAAIADDRAGLDGVLGEDGTGQGRLPPHVAAEMRLERAFADTEHAWLAALLDEVRDGALYFAGEGERNWVPPGDGSGWRLMRERELYLEQLQS